MLYALSIRVGQKKIAYHKLEINPIFWQSQIINWRTDYYRRIMIQEWWTLPGINKLHGRFMYLIALRHINQPIDLNVIVV